MIQFEDIMLSEIRQTKRKGILYNLPYIWNLITKYLQEKNKLIKKGSLLWLSEVRKGEKRDWGTIFRMNKLQVKKIK